MCVQMTTLRSLLSSHHVGPRDQTQIVQLWPTEPSLRSLSWFLWEKKYVCMVNNSFVFSYHCWSTWLVSCIFCCQGPHITLFPLPSFNQPLYPTPHMSKSPFPNPVPPPKGSGYRHSPNVISTLSFQLHMNVTCVFRQQEIKEANFFLSW